MRRGGAACGAFRDEDGTGRSRTAVVVALVVVDPHGLGAALPVRNGAPLRLRVERQLGYKMAKYLHAIEVVPDLTDPGSYWATKGYDWYAGI